MKPHFHDRFEAGRLLARQLKHYAHRPDVIILGLARGGVPVAAEVARKLDVPWDVFVVRKLGLPGHPELAIGAIASGGVRVLNEALVYELDIPPHVIDAIARREEVELRRRDQFYRGDATPLDVDDKIVVLVDDGIATGSTMRAVIRAIRHKGARKVVVAVPTAAVTTYQDLKREADERVALLTPEDFISVGQWYEDFGEVPDDEITRLLHAGDSAQLHDPVCQTAHH